jgi:hypothetical protein
MLDRRTLLIGATAVAPCMRRSDHRHYRPQVQIT